MLRDRNTSSSQSQHLAISSLATGALLLSACTFDAGGVPVTGDIDASVSSVDAAAAIDAPLMLDAAIPDAAIPDATIPDATPPIDAQLPDCFDNGDYTTDPMSGHRYRVISTGRFWATHRDDCEDDQGYLVVIGSEEENDHVQSLISGDHWIGYHDRDTEDVFEWVNGAPQGYENWDSNEPNDNGLGEDCVEMRGHGRWNDASCAALRGAVCECEPGFIP